MGAGLGTRLRPLTLSVPKPMLPVRGRPLAARIFDSLVRAGIGRIIVNTHHAAGRYAEYFREKSHRGAELVFVHEDELLDTGGGLKNILGLLSDGEPILVYNGDILYGGDIAAFIADFECGGRAASLLLRSEGAVKNVGVEGGLVRDMRGLLGRRCGGMMQFCGVFAASPVLLGAFSRRPGRVFSTVDVLVDFMRDNPDSVGAYVDDESEWTDIGTLEEYVRLK